MNTVSTLFRSHLSSGSLSESGVWASSCFIQSVNYSTEDISPHKTEVKKDLKQLLFFLLFNYASACVTECDVHDSFRVLRGIWQSLSKIGVLILLFEPEIYLNYVLLR